MRAPYGTALAAFDALAQINTDVCVPWPYSVNNWGYGQLTISGKTSNVHRLALARVAGEPPAGKMHAAHSCGNRRCLNHRHLRWATASENATEAAQLRKVVGKSGNAA